MTHVVLLTLLALTLSPAPPATTGPAGPDVIILSGATLINGTGARAQPDTTVVIRGERIRSVSGARSAAVETRDHPGARVIDLTGMYLLPGFIDMHAHVAILPERSDGLLLHHADRAASEHVLKTLLSMGITTVRNPAAPADDAIALRDAVANGRIAGPRIFTAGESLNAGSGPISGPGVRVADEAAVREEIRRQAGLGVDFIKLYASLPPGLVRAAITEAHARGLKVIGHLQETTWTQAAEDGIDFLTHCVPWSAEYLPESRRAAYEEFGGSMRGRIGWLEWVDIRGPEILRMVRLLARHKIAVDPTLIAYHTKFWGNDPRYLRSPDLALVPTIILNQWRPGWLNWSDSEFWRAQRMWTKVQQLVRLYYDEGVPLLAGSDMPNPWVVPGAGFHHELELLVEAGIPAIDVITIATANGAAALGIGGDTGIVKAGRRADLVVLTADPLQSIRNTRKIAWVMKGGVIHHPGQMQ